MTLPVQQYKVIEAIRLTGALSRTALARKLGYSRPLISGIVKELLLKEILAGGKGSYWGTMSGALVLTLIDSLLRAMQLQEAYQLIILGFILLVLISIYGRQRTLRQ